MSDEMDRLRAIERQLGRMNDKFDNIIRLEEKHVSLSAKVEGLASKLHKHANIIMQLQHTSSSNQKTLGGFERVLWMLLAAGFAVLSYLPFGVF